LLCDVFILENEVESEMRKKKREAEERFIYLFCTLATLHKPVVPRF
jgi:hypothetical protein